MSGKVSSKKAPASSSDSSSESSSDDEPTIKAPAKASKQSAAKTTPAPVKAAEKPAVKPADKPTPKAAAPKAKESAIPKPVPANKFPKRKAPSTSSSSSSSSSDDDEPATKKGKQQATPVNAAKANNLGSQQLSQPKVVPPSPKQNSAQSTPRHQPVSHIVPPSPKRDVPVVAATPSPVKKQFGSNTLSTAAGDDYPRTETKKAVTNMFGSNCPHCGHEIEVKVKFS